jgi:hypothetical protein
MRLSASKIVRTILGAVLGGAVGLLITLGVMVLCVVACAAAGGDRAVYDGEPWLVNLFGIAFLVGLVVGPLLGAIVGARRKLRGPCPACPPDRQPAP